MHARGVHDSKSVLNSLQAGCLVPWTVAITTAFFDTVYWLPCVHKAHLALDTTRSIEMTFG